MKRLLQYCHIIGISLLLAAGCSDSPSRGARRSIACGLPPVAAIAGEIAGDSADVFPVLPEGRSPHDFAPGIAEIRALHRADVFFYGRLPFERRLLNSLEGSSVRRVAVDRDVRLIPFAAAEEAHDHGHGHDTPDGMDPHVWLSPENCILIARTVAAELEALSPENAGLYRRNLAAFTARMSETGDRIRQAFAPYRGRAFYVQHPAFGYFAAFAGLRQESLEEGGREPSPRHLAELSRRAAADRVKVIFIQKEFNPSAARAMGQAIGGEVVELDALSGDLAGNFERISQSLLREFRR